MPNYKKMYLKMVNAFQKATKILIETQLECEELYLNSPEKEFKIISMPRKDEEEEK